MDVQGIVKSTVVRGEDDFPAGVLRVLDCHDCVVYALAPLQYAQILGCSNTTLVVGAASRMLRIQVRPAAAGAGLCCTRLQGCSCSCWRQHLLGAMSMMLIACAGWPAVRCSLMDGSRAIKIPVGGAPRSRAHVQGCTRVTVIATAVRVCIESCHECTFYLGVNRPPLLVGLNRFIQVRSTQVARMGANPGCLAAPVFCHVWPGSMDAHAASAAAKHIHAAALSRGCVTPQTQASPTRLTKPVGKHAGPRLCH